MAHKPRFSAANHNDILNDQRAIDRGVTNHQIEHWRAIQYRAVTSERIIIVKELAMRDFDRLSRATTDTSENRVGSFVRGFFGLLCAMAVGFVSELRPLVSNSVDYGYDEQLEAQAPSLSGAKLVSNCSDKGAATVGAADMESLDELRTGATTARGGPSSTAKHQIQAIGGHLVE
jgi:hypothetical protein